MPVVDKNQLKIWFKNLSKPVQEQFWNWMDSFYHKNEPIPKSGVENLTNDLAKKADLVGGVVPASQLPFTINTSEVIAVGEISATENTVTLSVHSSGENAVRINGTILKRQFPSSFTFTPVIDGSKFLIIYAVNDSGIFENTEPCVEFKDVTFGYDDHIVLNDMNFAIYPGEQVTLTGRTGAGKSTIFKLLLGLYRPNSGEALIEGEAAYRLSDKEKRKKFGYVEQSFHMVPGTVRDQITLFDPAIGDEAVQAAAKLVGLHGTIVSLDDGYDTLCKPEIWNYKYFTKWNVVINLHMD